SLRSVAGAAGSAYSPGLVPQHEQRLTIRTGSNAESAGLAVTFGQMGDLYPASSTRQVAAMADARLVASNATYTGSARYFDKSAGIGRNPLLVSLLPPATAPAGSTSRPAITSPDTREYVRQYTLSTNATIAPGGTWTHTLLAGMDGYSLNNIGDAAGPLPSQLDSALRAARGNGDRVTLRASSVAHLGTEGESDGTITFGLEESVLRLATTQTTRIPPTNGQLYPTAIDALVENWQHDTGLLSQLTMAWHDAMYVSGGLRLERNDAFSGRNRYPLLPMIGVAAVRGYGEAELKWRAAYGKGIRPPQTPARTTSAGYAGTLATSSLGAVIPALDPEEQSGYEGGLELYVGRTLSVQLTRFDQHVTGLIQNVAVGVDTVIRGKSIERRVRYELQNIGEITNTGWELQGNYTVGAFSLASALSSVDSRVRKLAHGYNGDLQEGDRILAVPAKTSSFTVSYLDGPWFAALGATRALDWINYDRFNIAVAYTKATYPASREITGPRLRSYWIKYDGDTHLRLTLSRELIRGVSLLMVGDNLLGGQLGEPDNVTIRAGRSITGGLRASF
ncbi:MAG TPA: TonB-dependent receptor, partial [Gemmatimonadaceae bacterium]